MNSIKPSQTDEEKKWKNFLKLLLIFYAFSILSILKVLIKNKVVSQYISTSSFIIINILNYVIIFFLIYQIYKWKKWAVYGFVGLLLFQIITSLNGTSQITNFSTFFSVILKGIIIFLIYKKVKPVWHKFENNKNDKFRDRIKKHQKKTN